MCGSGNVHERLPESGFLLEHRFSETRVGDHARGDEGAHDFGHDCGSDVRFGENYKKDENIKYCRFLSTYF